MDRFNTAQILRRLHLSRLTNYRPNEVINNQLTNSILCSKILKYCVLNVSEIKWNQIIKAFIKSSLQELDIFYK